jgi:hypothetical protein
VNDPTTWVPRTDEQIRADAEAARARAVAFELSPRGQFLHATQRIAEHPAHAEASSRLVALYNRSLADDRQPLDTAAVGAALTVLAGLSGRASQDAVEALAQLLMGRK